ncbi:MAG: DNA translocase FtsK 4TM domain-containing protein [Synergistetes bacterium]|nr:DNA translocase FtsK 4TM domain-containing protein [Synergistota bacterium]MDK2871847.1 segregation ATPase FtsK/SpoIIIE, family [bacterium]
MVVRDKRKIAIALFLLFASVFSIISLLNFKTGMVGNFIKGELLKLFGLSSYLFCLLLLFEGLTLLGLKLPMLPLFLLLPVSSLLFHFLIPDRLFPQKGGVVGRFLFAKLSYYIGTAGSAIVLTVAFLSILYWLFGKPMRALFSLFRERAGEKRPAKRREGKRREVGKVEKEEVSFDEEPISAGASKRKAKEKVPQTQEAVEKEEITIPPPVDLLYEPPPFEEDGEPVEEEKRELEETFANFGIDAKVVNVVIGPTVHRFEVQPARGVKVNRIASLSKEIALNLKAQTVRIEAPIPGKGLVGVEVPNKVRRVVYLKEIISSQSFKRAKGALAIALGRDVAGAPLVINISDLPHLLVAGSTGSGKSVCLNVIIMSLIFRNKPEDLRLVLIDPKRVEFSIYNEIPYLAVPVVTEVKDAVNVLNGLLQEMERRYKSFSRYGVRDITGFNKLKNEEKLPYVVVVIDELADLMMLSPREVEESICRLAQMARATGIHLVLATQRPSVNVVTGLIKANIPARIAFSLPSQADSRTILDFSGAERLLGKGDMLFLSPTFGHPIRAQCAWVSEDEVRVVTDYLRRLGEPEYWDELIKASEEEEFFDDIPQDPLYRKAIEVIVNTKTASATLLQRKLGVGYARAARLLDILEKMGIVGPSKGGGKPRDILKSEEELRELLE